jgi:hypothetical protein
MEGYDGTVGWITDERGVKLKNDWQIEFGKRNSILTSMKDVKQFKELYPTAKLKGVEKVGNRDAFVIEAEPVGARPETLYFDTQTGRLIKWDVLYQSSDSQKGVGTPMQLYIDEYADVNGVMIPVTIRQVVSGMTFTTRFFDTKYNVSIDDEKFKKPGK